MEIEKYLNLDANVMVDATRSIDLQNNKSHFLPSCILRCTLLLPWAMLGYDTVNKTEYNGHKILDKIEKKSNARNPCIIAIICSNLLICRLTIVRPRLRVTVIPQVYTNNSPFFVYLSCQHVCASRKVTFAS